MKQIPIVLLLLALTFSAMAQAPAEKPTILDVLKVDQKVSLKDEFGKYQLSLFENLPNAQAYTVKAIEADHLVVEDIVGVNEIHIPIYSIKSIVRVKLTGK